MLEEVTVTVGRAEHVPASLVAVTVTVEVVVTLTRDGTGHALLDPKGPWACPAGEGASGVVDPLPEPPDWAGLDCSGAATDEPEPCWGCSCGVDEPYSCFGCS